LGCQGRRGCVCLTLRFGVSGTAGVCAWHSLWRSRRVAGRSIA